LCFPRSLISYQEILHLGCSSHQNLSDVWVSHYVHRVSYLICLENHLCVLSICILIWLGYIRARVWNLKLSWIKIQYKRRCFLACGQSLTMSCKNNDLFWESLTIFQLNYYHLKQNCWLWIYISFFSTIFFSSLVIGFNFPT